MTVENFINCLDGFNIEIVDDSGNSYIPCECGDRVVLCAQPYGENGILIIFEK